jgi:hypothetical protein
MVMTGIVRAFLLAASILAMGSISAYAKDAPCPLAGQTPMQVTRLYFGQSQDGKPLAAGQWEDFLARNVTPRFPGGFTIYDARGQWQDSKTKTIAQEATRVVEIATPDSPDARRRIAELASLYQTRFHQGSVGIVSASACGAF